MAHRLAVPQGDVSVTPQADPAADAALQALLGSEAVERARAYLEESDPLTLAQQAELTGIPAPPFAEAERGRRMAQLMGDAGLVDVTTDAEGNVMGWFPAPGPGSAPVVISAHLDTVFPEGTDVTVRHPAPGRMEAPGIGDDGRGLTAILAVTRALAASGVTLRHPLLVVATVGEEGAGDLRGVRHLVGPQGAGREARAFISLDGAGHELVVNQGVGSRRFRVTVRGPGGHSWMDYGVANPLHALSAGVAALTALDLRGRATCSVGRMAGGTSVNAIPEEAWMDFEFRSRDESMLAALEPKARAALVEAVADANNARREGTEPLTLDVAVLGVRAAGGTPADTPLVRAAVAATRGLGYRPALVASSTDANAAMAAGIPAITLGAGGDAGGAHTLEEWYENVEGPSGLARALLTVLLLDELD